MLEMKDQDYRDSETVWVLCLELQSDDHHVLELTRTQVQDLLDNFDQDEN